MKKNHLQKMNEKKTKNAAKMGLKEGGQKKRVKNTEEKFHKKATKVLKKAVKSWDKKRKKHVKKMRKRK